MPKGTLLQVGFLAPQSKQILLASLRFSFSKMLCETVLGARVDIVVGGRVGDVGRCEWEVLFEGTVGSR
jgi:hypothetical protein